MAYFDSTWNESVLLSQPDVWRRTVPFAAPLRFWNRAPVNMRTNEPLREIPARLDVKRKCGPTATARLMCVVPAHLLANEKPRMTSAAGPCCRLGV